MTDEEALLAAVRAAPDDDLPRLVYADWLDDHGEAERAEFIRMQVELARLNGGSRCPICDWPYRNDGGCEPGNCSFRPGEQTAEYAEWKRRQTGYHDLRRREVELLADWREWAGPALDLIPDGACYYDHLTFRRGFVEQVRCAADAWVRHADDILARHPVRRVALTTEPDEGSFGFNHEGVWLGSDPDRIYPWADGEYPVRDRRVPIRRAFSSRWPGVGFEWPVEREDPRRDVDMGSVVR